MSSQPIRIAVLMFSHETVTFLKNDTTREDFIYKGSPAKGEALLAFDPQSYMGGFVKVAREHDGVELVGIESPLWPKTGTGSGWITDDAYQYFKPHDRRARSRREGWRLSLPTRCHGRTGVSLKPSRRLLRGWWDRAHRGNADPQHRARNSLPPPTWRSA
jgi:hypothetical protein